MPRYIVKDVGSQVIPLSQTAVVEQPEYKDSRRLPCRCIGMSGSFYMRLYCQLTALVVFAGLFLFHRCLDLLTLQPKWQRSAHQVCGLDPGHMLVTGDASHQLDRKDETECRQLQLLWHRGGLESAAGLVPRFRLDGWWFSRLSGQWYCAGEAVRHILMPLRA